MGPMVRSSSEDFDQWAFVTGRHRRTPHGKTDMPNGAADDATAHFLCHRFAQLVKQHECRLVGQMQVAAQRQCALALHFVAEHDREMVLQLPNYRQAVEWALMESRSYKLPAFFSEA